MTNLHRGEVAFELNGVVHDLCLTLGSLASLEEALGQNGLKALGERLSQGVFSAADICAVLAAGFSGGGHPLTADEIGAEVSASRLVEAATAASNLLASAFGGGASSRPPPPQAT